MAELFHYYEMLTKGSFVFLGQMKAVFFFVFFVLTSGNNPVPQENKRRH